MYSILRSSSDSSRFVVDAKPLEVTIGTTDAGGKKAFVSIRYNWLELEMVGIAVKCLESSEETPQIALYLDRVQVVFAVKPNTKECRELLNSVTLKGAGRERFTQFHVSSVYPLHLPDPESRHVLDVFEAYFVESHEIELRIMIPGGDLPFAVFTVRELKREPIPLEDDL